MRCDFLLPYITLINLNGLPGSVPPALARTYACKTLDIAKQRQERCIWLHLRVTTLAGFDYLQYPHTEAFEMPSIYRMYRILILINVPEHK